ncbi:MAG: hypothetical protein WBM90_02625, partial [Acidimicrobiia bacterium]
LSDSGVGRHQHVIIGQGEIGKVLNASPEEHRAVIEEAAGILKHRRRKERSERRLERTDEDMIRLQDLLGEIGRQMRPLRRQARAAERYDGLKGEVVSLRLYLGGVALTEHDRDMAKLSSERAALLEQSEHDQVRVGELSEQLSVLTESASRVGTELERDTSAAALLETTSERLRRIASVSLERSRAVSGRRDAAGERRADHVDEAGEIETRLESIVGERQETETHVQKSETRFRALEDEERSVTTQNSLSPEGALAAVRGELSAIEASLARDERESQTISHRLEILDGQRRDEMDEVHRINDEIRKTDEGLAGLQKAYDKAALKSHADQGAWADAEQSLSSARLEVASATARLEAITAAMQGRYDQEARRVVEDAPGAIGTLTSSLDIPEGMEAAVDAALGRWVDSIAFDAADSVRDVVELVKRGGGGSVPVVSAMSEGLAPAREAAESLGVEALIDRLGRQAHAGLAARLLGDVVLVEGWVTGWDLVARHPALRAVTPEGDLISVSGVLIASPDGAGPAMMESAEVALERAVTALARAESIHTAAKRDFDNSRELERRSLEDVEKAEAALAGRSEAMSRLQQSVDAIRDEHARLTERIDSLAEASSVSNSQAEALHNRLASLAGEEAERMKVWEELESQRIQLAAEKELARAEWHDAAAKHRAVVEEERLLVDRLRRVRADLERLDSGETSNADPDALRWIEAIARRAVATLERRIGELRDRQAHLRSQNGDLLGELEKTRAEHDSLRASILASRDRTSEIDIKLTELRMTRESVVESIRRDADADVDAAIGAPRPPLP